MERYLEKIYLSGSIGVLIENPAFIGNYTGFKNLKVLASIQNRIGDEQIRKALEDIGLDPDDKRTYRSNSLGMEAEVRNCGEQLWKILILLF